MQLGYPMPRTAPDFGLQVPRTAWPMPAAFGVLIPNASRKEKLWPEARWVAVGRKLRSHGLTPVVLWGSEAEQTVAERIAADCGGTVPPFLLYVYLWEHAHLELVWPLYIAIALSITLTTVLIWWEAAVSVNAPGPPGAPLDYEWPKVSALTIAW